MAGPAVAVSVADGGGQYLPHHERGETDGHDSEGQASVDVTGKLRERAFACGGPGVRREDQTDRDPADQRTRAPRARFAGCSRRRADEVLDYATDDFTRPSEPYDLVLDLVAHRSVFAYRHAVNRGGVTGVWVGRSARCSSCPPPALL